MSIATVVSAILVTVLTGVGSAQTLIDRVVARVNGTPVTLSDVRAALGMGLIAARADDLPLATEQVVQRLLLLLEVERFPPPEPSSMAVDQEEARIRGRLGASFATVASQTGLDERQIRQSARDTLRIRAYLDQRFGADQLVSDEEVRAYFMEHPAEFTRDGVRLSFEEAEPLARQRASGARRDAAINQWIADLRQRAEVATAP